MVSQEERNKIITELFREGLEERFCKIDKDGTELQGYYLLNPSRKYYEIRSMKQLKRIFVNIKKKASGIYGETMESDFENQLSEAYMYLYMAFDEVFRGDAKVEEDLQVKTVDDIYRIINDEALASKLCRWCITYVDMKFKTFMKTDNVDFNYNSDGTYTKIDYYYLDQENEDGTSRYEELGEVEQLPYETGEFADYILETYFDKLTHKQQLFMKTFLQFGQDAQGHISMEDGTILYVKQEYQNYRKAIGKKLLRLISENDNQIVENEYGRYTLDWNWRK